MGNDMLYCVISTHALLNPIESSCFTCYIPYSTYLTVLYSCHLITHLHPPVFHFNVIYWYQSDIKMPFFRTKKNIGCRNRTGQMVLQNIIPFCHLIYSTLQPWNKTVVWLFPSSPISHPETMCSSASIDTAYFNSIIYSHCTFIHWCHRSWLVYKFAIIRCYWR